VDEVFPRVLVVRDLASGKQLEALPVPGVGLPNQTAACCSSTYLPGETS
jgi:hypothetical protein